MHVWKRIGLEILRGKQHFSSKNDRKIFCYFYTAVPGNKTGPKRNFSLDGCQLVEKNKGVGQPVVKRGSGR
jgi:hypothetical protein